ncbi:AAA family ATPase [Trichocoleus sp. FACHB-262]|uniref:AAA family ATPase n=1 Tax=Trichocoleus sp. FACHB-262 TaxID=2692869 RepID=UPI00168379AC|nr:ATP-binding protein [Trichocoleus sp. FACHB-262]MBD2120097.1 AAA family ATPase [Trichocoleus sp. FACHB-262]
MLKKLILENWKSFRYAELPIDPLTILIGTNASGKSNALEALDFLSRIASGQEIKSALTGDRSIPPIRGGVQGIAFKPEIPFRLTIQVQGRDEYTDYLYCIDVETKPKTQLHAEALKQTRKPSKKHQEFLERTLFEAKVPSSQSLGITLEVHDTPGSQRELEFQRVSSVLSQIKGFSMDLVESTHIASQALQRIFVLDPIPSMMRDYSPLSEALQRDAANIAGVIAALPEQDKSHIEATLAAYVRHLPERDIHKVWAEPVGRLHTDAMLYCEESWVPGGEPTVIDARGMSDGTLRFLAILTALLTRPEGSQLVIEEVDNGLHPSRADLLLKMLREIGEQRQIDVLVTTHNPALLNALEPEMIPFVIVTHRDSQTGESKLTPLEDLKNLPKLMASGPLGKLAEQGSIERSLSSAN